jgi:hypothetical protein
LIKKRTVFVLGAGANVPYGFSTGEGLLAKARELTVEQMASLTCGQMQARQMSPLANALSDNFLPSIDALLEHRADLRSAGKKLMLSLLLDEEQNAIHGKRKPDEDWMALVFAQMAEGADTVGAFGSNPVSFITFNYDRFLENRLIRGLVARYNVTSQEAWNAIGRFQFIHLYGSLGELPEQKIAGTPGYAIPFGAPGTPEVTHKGLALSAADSAIAIVHDPGAESRFAAAHALLHGESGQVLFFGFAFGRENVDRLQTKQISPAARICCTTYGMTAAEVADSVNPAFPKHITGLYYDDATIKQFLRERIWVFR